MTIQERIQQDLFASADQEYRVFQAKLTPGKDLESMIGVRTPVVRNLAKTYANDPDIDAFLQDLPHSYYDEDNLHGFIIEKTKDFDTCIKQVDEFLEYVDNWATCDMVNPKVFKKPKETEKLLPYIRKWMKSSQTYRIRYGIRCYMSLFLQDLFQIQYAEEVATVKSDEYYVNMMIAWYFATALAKQYDAILPFIEEKRLSKWVHNKTIQKAVESFRITKEQKDYLRTLRIK